MAPSERYRQQAALLVRTIPAIAAEDCFALKGGTAINLFIRDMPRLSVDIDLTFLPVMPWQESLAAIEEALLRIKQRLETNFASIRVVESRTQGDGPLIRLIVQLGRAQIKIEVTPVLRGSVFAPELRTVSQSVEEQFGFAEMRVVSFADLYAGKIMAALDRQHPRDLFDVRGLLAKEGIDDGLRRAFIVYLVSHDRPISEVLNARRKDLATEFSENFEGMTAEPLALAELLKAREALVAAIISDMLEAHREFLMGFKQGTPDWTLLDLPDAANLPAVRWKQINLDKLSVKARDKMAGQLKIVLGRSD
ncbi:MAG: nucleotidyl transferase AbiEii/AbiGii toxin family protein [Aestuariivirga sp.]|nr:nucleotidyl transferase AbiEii/AbiGii toxin family protein [Aestuariivirga sp.]